MNTVPGSSPSAAHAAYEIVAAPAGAWRRFDPHHPDPGCYEFDWLSSQHPDLYYAFALSTEGLTAELEQLVDLRGLTVIDMGARDRTIRHRAVPDGSTRHCRGRLRSQLQDPAGLQSTLHADGVPASVTFLHQQNPRAPGTPAARACSAASSPASCRTTSARP